MSVIVAEEYETLMIKNPDFEITEISGEFMAIPVGECAETFRGVVALNDASYFLLKNLEAQKTMKDLVRLLCNEFDVGEDVALQDVQAFVDKLLAMGVILET